LSLDEVADADEANQRMEKIVEAWNALRVEERLRRSPASGNAGSRMGSAITKAAGQLQDHGELAAGWQLPESPRLDDPSDDEQMFPSDPAVSAPQLRAAGFIRQVLALVDWVGDGRAVTRTDVLRPAVAKQAYADLGLWQWERDWLLAGGLDLPADPRMDAVLAQTGLSGWRTAADCLALDRLWLPAIAAGLIGIDGSLASADRSRVPDTDVGRAHLGQMLLLALASRSRPEGAFDPLLGILFSLFGDAGEPHTEAELAEWWRASPANALASGLARPRAGSPAQRPRPAPVSGHVRSLRGVEGRRQARWDRGGLGSRADPDRGARQRVVRGDIELSASFGFGPDLGRAATATMYIFVPSVGHQQA